MAKIVNELVLNEAIKQLGQLIADNSYDFIPYTDEEISDLFSLKPEEVAHLTDLIADTVISQYKLWSSKKVNDELTKAKSECNDYTDSMLSNISSITIDYVEQLPVTGDSSIIYILKATDSSAKDTLNLYKDGSWTNIGDFEIDLTKFYDKTEIDQLLLAKANDNEVVKQDDVIVDTSQVTTTNVLSATTTIEELNKKANDDEVLKKTDISTTLDSSSTNDKVPTSKTVWDSLYKICNPQVLVDANNPTSKICMADLTTLNTPAKEGVTSAESSLIISIEGRDYWNGQISIAMAEPEVYVRSVRDAGTWTKWRRLCSTIVADVEWTTLTVESGMSGTIKYRVKNGICFVNIYGLISSTMSTQGNIITNGLPIPEVTTDWYGLTANDYTKGGLLVSIDNTGRMTNYIGENGSYYFGTFSYPVKE